MDKGTTSNLDMMNGTLPQLKKDPGKAEGPSISFLQLFRYSTTLDKFLLFIGAVSSVVAATTGSLFTLVFGDVSGVILDYVTAANRSITEEDQQAASDVLIDGLTFFVIAGCVLGAICFILTYISTVTFNYSAIRQIYTIRSLYLDSVLNKDIAWYDVNQTGDFASRVTDDLKKVEDGIGEKISMLIYVEFVFLTSLIQSFIRGWELTLICLVTFPITLISMGVVSRVTTQLSQKEMNTFGLAGVIAEEVFSSIRTVVAFDGQKKEIDRYNKQLKVARNTGVKRAMVAGLNSFSTWFLFYASYSLAFWYGVRLILDEKYLPKDEITYTSGNVITIFFSVLTGVWYFGMAAPYLEAFGIARGAAAKIFSVIDGQPTINASKGNGKIIEKLKGQVTFKNIHFKYPSRPNIQILQGFTLSIESGQKVALVGSSGCGKSTCIQLMQRFYDPDAGEVYLDDYNLKELDLTWLRNNIGVVGQEPVLFETTIAENIKYGNRQATFEEIQAAATKANAHKFISNLPLGYHTMVGERGAQLSGGQKQRIAIARALVREPPILLLDEATSALDTSSEATVQAALDAASDQRTTIIVAHRLSTVRSADKIVFISEGQVVEQGSHDELMKLKGGYYSLVKLQTSGDEDESAQRAELERQFSSSSQDKELAINKLSLLPEDQADIAQLTKKEEPGMTLWDVMKMNSPEKCLLIFGLIGSFFSGAAMPVYSIAFGEAVSIFSSDDDEFVRSQGLVFSMYFLAIGVVAGTAMYMQTHFFGIAGENLTMRLRSQMFQNMLKQEIGWFDDSDNGVGSICARLSGEPASVQGATGIRIGTILNSAATVLLAITMAFIYEWRLSLVALCFTPILVIASVYEQKIMNKDSKGNQKSIEKSTKIAVEAISSVRTVAALGCEKMFHQRYIDELIPELRTTKKNTHIRGLVYAVSRSIMFFSYTAALYYGGVLVRDEHLDTAKVFVVTEALLTGAWSVANAFAFTPNFSKGIMAASRINRVLNRKPKIESGSENISKDWGNGNIEYQDIHFSYPNRPRIPILRGLDLSVIQGKTVALVGPSGSGKSTIIQLLERFYDPRAGTVSVDGVDTKTMNLTSLRSQMGIVSQEPNLFSKTIAQNIAYGDNSREVDKQDIIEAAKQANIHKFITSLPLGYETKLGDKGTQLSGGQKQRIAIARALVKNPKVLLLDEATSALDMESERIVQEALDNAKQGRTCITIAHRLTTIQDADVICVISRGKVAEIGKHSELLELRKIYYKLHKLQSGKHH